MITAEVAVYPLKTDNATRVINNSINTLKSSTVGYKVTSMNTILSGSKDTVFDSIKGMFDEAEKSGGEINMVVTIGNAAK